MISLIEIFEELTKANSDADAEVSVRVRGGKLQFDVHSYSKDMPGYRLVLSKEHCLMTECDFSTELRHFAMDFENAKREETHEA